MKGNCAGLSLGVLVFCARDKKEQQVFGRGLGLSL